MAGPSPRMGSPAGRLGVVVQGTLEGAEHYDADALYCRFAFVHGDGWEIVRFSGQGQRLPLPVARKGGASCTQILLTSPGPWSFSRLVFSLIFFLSVSCSRREWNETSCRK